MKTLKNTDEMGHFFIIIPELFFKSVMSLTDEEAGQLLKSLINAQQKRDVHVGQNIGELLKRLIIFYHVLASDYEYTVKRRQ